MSVPLEESTLRRLVRFSDAVRDAIQNPRTFALTPDDATALAKIVERIDQEIARNRRL